MPIRRRKLAQDPNNTAWSRDTTTYGQRILAQQGWKPGNYLGAKSAAHASHYTVGSAGHVRVSLKDDTLGLGASQPAQDEATGLGNFQDLLGRLNGKEQSKIEEEQYQRKTLGMKMYAQQRWGVTKFVKAGYLVGDKIEPHLPSAASTNPMSSKHADELNTGVEKVSSATPETADVRKAAPQKTDKSRRKEEKKRLKEERRAEKLQRREHKRARRAAREAKRKDSELSPAGAASSPNHSVAVTTEDLPPSSQAAPVRRNVRERFLAQKRKSAMDPRALNEILMIKSSG